MLEYIILLAIILVCVFIEAESKILYLFLFLIPFHSFIKSCLTFYYGGGELFSFWKEIVILILVFKLFRKPSLKIASKISLLLLIFAFIIFIYFIILDNPENALPTLRDHLFSLLFFIAISKMKFNDSIFRTTIIIISISVLLTNIFGLIQHFFLNEQLSLIMGRIDFIDEGGYIQYTTNSARIMGYERMAGILGGGPNMFGVFNGFAIVFLYGVLTNTNKSIISSKLSKFITFTLIISFVCIILSFSRAGWGIAIIGIFVLSLFDKKKKRLKYFFILTISSFIISLILILYNPNTSEIIYNSISGKEESASKRSGMITELIPVILDQPFGHGLGTADIRSKTKLFFAESAFTNIAFEIGVLGLLYLIFIHLSILSEIRKISNYNYFAKTSIAIGVASLIICFVSVNPYGMPYIYFWWFILGIGINRSNLKKITKNKFIIKPLNN